MYSIDFNDDLSIYDAPDDISLYSIDSNIDDDISLYSIESNDDNNTSDNFNNDPLYYLTSDRLTTPTMILSKHATASVLPTVTPTTPVDITTSYNNPLEFVLLPKTLDLPNNVYGDTPSDLLGTF